MTEIKTPLTCAYEYVEGMINACNGYWSFHVVDLGIECFSRTYPEQIGKKQQLIDLRADRWQELFGNKKA